MFNKFIFMENFVPNGIEQKLLLLLIMVILLCWKILDGNKSKL